MRRGLSVRGGADITPPPVCYGLALCDVAVVEARTGRVSLINTFSGIAVARFPIQVAPFAAYTVLTDGQGQADLEFTITALDNGEQVYSHSSRQAFANRLQEVQYLLRVRTCQFSRPGRYEAALFADGQLIARRPFSVYLKGTNP
jgi:hypothetical protein